MPDYLMSPNSSEIDYEERILSLVTHVYVTDFKQRRLFDTLHCMREGWQASPYVCSRECGQLHNADGSGL